MDPFNRDMESQDKGTRIMGPGVEGGGEGGYLDGGANETKIMKTRHYDIAKNTKIMKRKTL